MTTGSWDLAAIRDDYAVDVLFNNGTWRTKPRRK
jgi:hypothetical protein